MYAIKFVRTQLIGSADAADLPWQAIPGHGDYATPGEAWAACDEFDQAFDGAYTHRAFEVANDTEEA